MYLRAGWYLAQLQHLLRTQGGGEVAREEHQRLSGTGELFLKVGIKQKSLKIFITGLGKLLKTSTGGRPEILWPLPLKM